MSERLEAALVEIRDLGGLGWSIAAAALKGAPVERLTDDPKPLSGARPIDSFGNPFVECREILAHRYGILAPKDDEVCKCAPGHCALDDTLKPPRAV